jgi:hypothetical protein
LICDILKTRLGVNVERSALARTYTEPAVELSKVPTVMAIYG